MQMRTKRDRVIHAINRIKKAQQACSEMDVGTRDAIKEHITALERFRLALCDMAETMTIPG